MAIPSASNEVTVTPGHRLVIVIEQQSQDQSKNQSSVHIRGIMYNDSGPRSKSPGNSIHREIYGTADYDPGNFGFDISTGGKETFLDHTFAIVHDEDGTKTVDFTVEYGDTQTAAFGANQTSRATLVLTRIPKKPAPPGPIVFSNLKTNAVTVSWTATTDDGGAKITTYELRRYTGATETGSYKDDKANNLSRNVTGLSPGKTYTFDVHCQNSAGVWSDWAGEASIGLFAGPWLRIGGVWRMVVPYVRDHGVWKLAVPYVRKNGAWKNK